MFDPLGNFCKFGENGTKDGEFNYPRSLSVRKAECLWSVIPDQPRNSGVLTVWKVCYNNTFCCELLNRTGLGQCIMQASTELCLAFFEFFTVLEKRFFRLVPVPQVSFIVSFNAFAFKYLRKVKNRSDLLNGR